MKDYLSATTALGAPASRVFESVGASTQGFWQSVRNCWMVEWKNYKIWEKGLMKKISSPCNEQM